MGRTFQMGAKMTLKDSFSSTISKIGQATNSFTKNVKSSKDGLGQYKDAQGRLRDSTGKYIGDLKNAKKHGESLTKTMGGMRTAAGLLKWAFATIGIAAAFKTAKSYFIDANSDMETYKNTLAVVLKSEEKATKTLQWATKFAAQTPFEIPQIVEATTRMASYGLNAQKTLGIVGDMASVMGKDLMSAVEAVADAQTGEVERLKEFGITKNMIVEKAKQMKITVMNNKGQITDQKAFNAALFSLMEDKYKGGMEMQSKTLKGMISNFKDFVSGSLRTMGQPVFDKFKQGIGVVLDWLNKMKESGALDTFIGKVQKVGGTIYNGFVKYIVIAIGYVRQFSGAIASWYSKNKPLIDSFVNSIVSQIKKISSFLFTYIVPAASMVISVVGKIATKFLTWYNQSSPLISKITSKMISIFGQLYTMAKPVIDWLAVTAIPAVTSALAKVGTFVLNIANWFTSNWSTIGPLLAGIAISFVAITTAMKVYKAVQMAIQIATILWTNKQLLLNAVMSANPIGLIILGVGLLIGAIILLVKNWATVKAVLLTGCQAIGNFFKNIFTGIGNFFKNVFNGIKNFFEKWGITILAIMGGPFTFIPFIVAKNWDKIKEFLGAGVDWLKEAFKSVGEFIGGVFTGLVSIIKAPINFILAAINTMIGAMNGISIDIPDWVPLVGGKKFGFSIPEIPYLAKGTQNWGGGPAYMNERGGELAMLPNGSKVIPADKTDKILGAPRGGGVTIEKIEIKVIAQPGQDAHAIAEEVIDILYEKMENAKEIAGSNDMGGLVNA